MKNGLIWNIFFGPSKEMTLQYISYSTLYPTTFHIWHTHDTKEVSGWAFRVNLRFLCEFHVWPSCPHRSSRLHGCFWRKWLSENILTFFWGERIVSDACKADLGSDFNFFTSRATHNGYDDILNFFRPSPPLFMRIFNQRLPHFELIINRTIELYNLKWPFYVWPGVCANGWLDINFAHVNSHSQKHYFKMDLVPQANFLVKGGNPPPLAGKIDTPPP